MESHKGSEATHLEGKEIIQDTMEKNLLQVEQSKSTGLNLFRFPMVHTKQMKDLIPERPWVD